MLETKICLMIIYNHRYDKNIPKLEELYKDKFSYIYHIVPFYDGNKSNVITVYESSYYFSNYIAQAYQHLKNENFTHFFVVADDMIINPQLNERTFWEVSGIKNNECYISKFIEMHNQAAFWGHTEKAMKYSLPQKGIEIDSYLPSKDEAIACFRKHGLNYKSLSLMYLLRSTDWKQKIRLLLQLPLKRDFDYPLIGGYSDILMVTADVMDKFCQYCGIFAATNLFVEVALPTSLLLSADRIVFGSNSKLKDGAIWNSNDEEELLGKYHFTLKALLNDFPSNYMFIHPVKLSKWK